MWSAIKNDLFEFVSTVQSDTQETLAKVIETRRVTDSSSPTQKKKNHEKERMERKEKMIEELTQSFSTYAEDVDQKYQQQFQKFKSTFSLSSHSSDIARILEWENEVSKYYCDLVPDTLTAELFWARYYFKLDGLKSKSFANNLDDEEDEEEELTWDDEADTAAGTCINGKLKEDSPVTPIETTSQPITTSNSSQSLQDQTSPLTPLSSLPASSQEAPSSNITTATIQQQPSPPVSTSSNPDETVMPSLLSSLQQENSYLTTRVSDLENEVQRLKEELKYYHTHYPPSLSFPNSESSVSSIDEDHPNPAAQRHEKAMYPIQSYVKVSESGGESDGLVVLSTEINSDSDFGNTKYKGQQTKKASSSSKTNRLATIASTEESETAASTNKSGVSVSSSAASSGKGEERSVESVKGKRPTAVVAAKGDGRHEDDEEDEEEVGWDDSGW